MKELGRVLHISPSKKAVMRVQMTPKIGQDVFDENDKHVGRVFDIFGPTDSPYVAIESRNPQELIDKVIYTKTSWKMRIRKRR